MNIFDFKKTTLDGYSIMGYFNNCEIEGFMVWFLEQCIKVNDIDAAINTIANEDYLCDMNILEKVNEQQYRLTESSKEKLLEVYKKEFLEPEEFSL